MHIVKITEHINKAAWARNSGDKRKKKLAPQNIRYWNYWNETLGLSDNDYK